MGNGRRKVFVKCSTTCVTASYRNGVICYRRSCPAGEQGDVRLREDAGVEGSRQGFPRGATGEAYEEQCVLVASACLNRGNVTFVLQNPKRQSACNQV